MLVQSGIDLAAGLTVGCLAVADPIEFEAPVAHVTVPLHARDPT